MSSPHIRARLLTPRGPPVEGPVCCELSCHPIEPLRGSARSSREAHIHFWLYFTARFRAFPRTHAGPKAAAVGNEGVGLPGKLEKVQHAVVLLPDPSHTARGNLLAHHVQLNMPVSPHVFLLPMQAVGVKSL
jgi:hypothetical protein